MSIAAPITPLPVPLDESVRTVILFGGSFDPVHRAHAALPQAIRAARPELRGAWLVYVPAARSPHKEQGPVASDADRLEMLRLALGKAERAAIWTDELDRAPPGTVSYTVDTVVRARIWLDERRAAHVQLRLLIGADQAADFHRWRTPRALITMARPLVMLRPPAQYPREVMAALQASGAWAADDLRIWQEGITPLQQDAASASEIRRLLAGSPQERQQTAAMLPPAVFQYIERNGLYKRPRA